MTTNTAFDQDRMTREQAAEYLGLSTGTLSNWASNGSSDLPYYNVGKRVYYRRSDLDAWLEKQKRTRTAF